MIRKILLTLSVAAIPFSGIALEPEAPIVMIAGKIGMKFPAERPRVLKRQGFEIVSLSDGKGEEYFKARYSFSLTSNEQRSPLGVALLRNETKLTNNRFSVEFVLREVDVTFSGRIIVTTDEVDAFSPDDGRALKRIVWLLSPYSFCSSPPDLSTCRKFVALK